MASGVQRPAHLVDEPGRRPLPPWSLHVLASHGSAPIDGYVLDAASHEICAIRRVRTNTPLQSLVTLNDPVYVEAAQALARRIVRDGGPNVASRVRHGLQLCLARPPRPEQVEPLVALYHTRT